MYTMWDKKIRHFEVFKNKIKILSTHYLLRPKFAGVCQKVATQHQFFNRRRR